MKDKIIKIAEVYRIPRLKDYIEEFIAHDLDELLVNLKLCGVITGHLHVSRLTVDFLKGVDFYILLGHNLEVPVQITDNKENIEVFSKQGIITIFLPRKDEEGNDLCAEEKRRIIAKGLAEALKRKTYYTHPN